MLRTVPRIYKINSELLNGKIHQLPTHEVLTRLGFVSHPKPGLVNYLPMGMLVLDKLQAVIHENMANAGAEQVRMSTLSSSQGWEKSGRWHGSELFKLKDASGQRYCLAPTCEEDITELVKSLASSYKDYPLLYYQINTKFRDEKRPRSGLLRGREFIMKDAYLFDISPSEAMNSYNSMVETYTNVLKALRVSYVKAEADTGEIGGLLSHEWHYVHETGEDTLYTCDRCHLTLNMEKTLSYPVSTASSESLLSPVSVRYFTTTDLKTLVCAYYPSDRTLRPSFVREEIPDLDLSDMAQEQILAEFTNEDTLISKRIVRVMDLRLHLRSNFPDFPIKFINKSLITTLTDVPIVDAQEGELCHKCEEGVLHKRRAIEVGHTFFLGEKYSQVFGLQTDVPDKDGRSRKQNIIMGCYGLGISRIMAAIAEIQRDSLGLRWPACIAPWQVTVINTSKEDMAKRQEELLAQLSASNIDYRVDEGDVRLGRKIKYSSMFGIPLVIILGRNYPQVEIETRGIQYGQTWRDLQQQTESWTLIEESSSIKHSVHIHDAGKAVQALLADM